MKRPMDAAHQEPGELGEARMSDNSIVNGPVRVAFVAEGDANTRDCWSGCALGFVSALRTLGADVTAIDVEPKGWRRRFLGLRTIRPRRSTWRGEYTFGGLAFRTRSALAREGLRPLVSELDAIIQAGATFRVPAEELGLPLLVYLDSNVRMAERGLAHSFVRHVKASARERMAARESAVYHSAAAVWTFSEYAARSIVDDFDMPEERVHAIYAGPNSVAVAVEEIRPITGPPRVLFVGRDYRRKGLDVLLSAFEQVKLRVPDAELHVVGAALPRPGPGVFFHGFVPWNVPEGRSLIEELFRTATVMCLPSRYEPFGVAFVEAMHMGVPCIGTDQWAMPEIIERDVTGWLVPDGDVGALARTLVSALKDRGRSSQMGEAARQRARKLFTWEAAAQKALEQMARMGIGSHPRDTGLSGGGER